MASLLVVPTRDSRPKEFPSQMDIHRLGVEDTKSLIDQLKTRTQMVKEETLLLSTHLIRLYDMRHSTVRRIESGSIIRTGGGGVVSKLAKDIARRHFQSLARRQQNVKNLLSQTSFQPDSHPPLTDSQKTMILEKELRHYQKYLREVEEELLHLQDGFEAKTEEIAIFLQFIANLRTEFCRKMGIKATDTGNWTKRKGNANVNMETLLQWFRYTLIRMESMTHMAKLQRTKYQEESARIKNKILRPVDNTTTVDFLTLEVRCQQSAETVINHIEKIAQMERKWNIITRQRTRLRDELGRCQADLVDMDNKIKVCRDQASVMKEKIKDSDRECTKLAHENARLVKGMADNIYPSVQNYMLIEQENELLRKEFKLWQNKMKVIENLQHVRPSSANGSLLRSLSQVQKIIPGMPKSARAILSHKRVTAANIRRNREPSIIKETFEKPYIKPP